jgi:uncharacterized protein (TIGR03083 family)
MPGMDSAVLIDTTRACHAVLASTPPQAWSSRLPGLEWTVAETVAHIADCCIWYATDLVAGAQHLPSISVKVKPDASPVDLLSTIEVGATVLVSVIDRLGEDARGWHPCGIADPAGFAAMACDELLVHTWDVARGLGVEFTPPPELVLATLSRLFPWAPADVQPWQALLWANGRIALAEHGRMSSDWRWHCAPLSEWDGTRPGTVLVD